eukprot:3306791-Pleurochrysis_carterae.AAC.1
MMISVHTIVRLGRCERAVGARAILPFRVVVSSTAAAPVAIQAATAYPRSASPTLRVALPVQKLGGAFLWFPAKPEAVQQWEGMQFSSK